MTRTTALAIAGISSACAIAVTVAAMRHHASSAAHEQNPPLLARPGTFVTEIPRVEEASDAITKSVKRLFLKPVQEHNARAAKGAFRADFLGRFPGPEDAPVHAESGLRIRAYAGPAGPAIDGDALAGVLDRHIQGWAIVERASWRIFETLLGENGASAFVSAHLEIGGATPSGTRGDLQGVVEAEMVLEGSDWKFRRLELKSGVRADADVLPFAEISAETGFAWNFSAESGRIFQQLVDQRGPNTVGGISAVDWNADGYWDLIATLDDKTSVLFVNDGCGGFRRVALPFKSPQECGNVVLFADLDGDGLEEIVTGRILSVESGKGHIGIYTRRSGAWELLPTALTFDLPPGIRDLLSQTVVPGDINGDGLPDLFVGFYSHSGSRQERFSNIEAYDGADDLLFVNHGHLSFTEESDTRGIHSTQYTLAAAFFDIDGDGDQDLIQVNDYGPNVVWENSGKGEFSANAEHPLARDPGYNMGVCIGDVDNAGTWSIHISDMYSHAGNRILRLSSGLGPELLRKARVLAGGNRMFESVPGSPGKWIDSGQERGIACADWAWSCNFLDVDNDGDLDLFVTNGYTSNADRSLPDY